MEGKIYNPERLTEVAFVFLKLGILGFGGPVAHIAMMEDEIVTKRKWITREYFLDLIGATNLIPGPNSTEMTMHCGHERAGIPGLFVAGICFILPAAIITGVFGWLYYSYGSVPEVEPILYGIKPAIIAIIANAIFNLGTKAVRNIPLAIIGIMVVAAALAGFNEIYTLLSAGILTMFIFGGKEIVTLKKSIVLPVLLASLPASVPYSTSKLFWIFFKIGATLFGSGYVLVAYLQAELVETTHWISQQQLLDAIAIGQFTPGPLLSTATFIGFQIDGLTGAAIATCAIFLPSFFFVLLLNPLVSKLRKSRIPGFFLDGVNIGALGVMVAATYTLGTSVLVNREVWIIFLVSMYLVFGLKKLNATWIIIGGAMMGYLFRMVIS